MPLCEEPKSAPDMFREMSNFIMEKILLSRFTPRFEVECELPQMIMAVHHVLISPQAAESRQEIRT